MRRDATRRIITLLITVNRFLSTRSFFCLFRTTLAFRESKDNILFYLRRIYAAIHLFLDELSYTKFVISNVKIKCL